ncbi:cytochrome P450 [Glycomyces sp. L485]|uniref:cytochrome P450 n=1 Tax=Glycomyces sp. L485 TaxID=2909235 RepID=UPI001F4A5E12|nr:cytochrome P450 [Glycomyces sp. L485]MCH7230944.1 cytochrome P450 [Glycomyces sp. L485]
MDPNGRGAGFRAAPVASSFTPDTAISPPGPAPRPFGLPPDDFDRDPMACLSRLGDEYGDVFTFATGRVALTRPEWVHWVLARTNRETRVNPPETPRGLRRRPLIRDRVETWMAGRRTAQWHRLGRDIAERTDPVIRLHLRRFLDAAEHAPVRLPDCERVVLEATGEVFVRDLEGDLWSLLVQAADHLLPQGTSPIELPEWMSRFARRRVRANDAWIEALVAHVQMRRRSRDPAVLPSDLLDLLLDARDDDRPAFTDVEIAQTLSINLGNLYAVGGSGLAWLLAANAEHDFIRPEATDRRDWAGAVVKETLRAYPVIALTSRELVEDTVFGDVSIPAGTSVFISSYLLHTDPRWWRADPSRFDPARWLADEVHDQHAYLPYGAGPRICTGVHIANAVLETAADLLLDRTVTAWRGPPRPHWGSIMRPRRFRVRVVPDAR